MFTIHHVNELPPVCDEQLRLAVTVAIRSNSTASEDPEHSPPLLLMRLTKRSDDARLGVVGHHLSGPDAVQQIRDLTPQQCRAGQHELHLGALAAVGFTAAPDDSVRTFLGEAAAATEFPAESDVEQGKILVGVTMSGWSLAMAARWNGPAPAVHIAEPDEFGTIGSTLADALAAFNDRFRAVAPIAGPCQDLGEDPDRDCKEGPFGN